MKVCRKCNLEKDYSEFYKDSHLKDGYESKCKSCKKGYENIRKEKIQQYQQKYYLNNKDKILKKSKKYDLENKEKKKKYQQQFFPNYYKKNKQIIFENRKKWYQENKEYCIKKSTQDTNIRYHNDPNFKLRILLRSRLYELIKKHKNNKSKSAIKLLGCSIKECKQHLESNLLPEWNWSNHGIVWEIDHIIPCSSFDLSDPEQQRKCFHFTNLQPLSISENRSKGNKVQK